MSLHWAVKVILSFLKVFSLSSVCEAASALAAHVTSDGVEMAGLGIDLNKRECSVEWETIRLF